MSIEPSKKNVNASKKINVNALINSNITTSQSNANRTNNVHGTSRTSISMMETDINELNKQLNIIGIKKRVKRVK
jgi:hypothetical protein